MTTTKLPAELVRQNQFGQLLIPTHMVEAKIGHRYLVEYNGRRMYVEAASVTEDTRNWIFVQLPMPPCRKERRKMIAEKRKNNAKGSKKADQTR